MTADEIEETYGRFPREAVPEVMQVASDILDSPNVAGTAIQSNYCQGSYCVGPQVEGCLAKA